MATRRQFLTGLGLASAAALSQGKLLLAQGTGPTEASGSLDEYSKMLAAAPAAADAKTGDPKGGWNATEDNILGPYHRKFAPYRAKLTDPFEKGTVLVVTGRVWGLDTKKPLSLATLDVWQADEDGHYDNEDDNNPPAADFFKLRSRMVTDEKGRYEFESIHPGRYKISATVWRPAHVHFMVSAPGYKTLVTQMYFKGDPHNATDQFIKKSLIMDIATKKVGANSYEHTVFDIVLEPK